MSVEERARELSRALERVESRPDREDAPGTVGGYVRLRDGAPEWMRDACREAHNGGEILPDDWRYEFIEDSASELAECEGDVDRALEVFEQSESYPYTAQLTGWLHSAPWRYAYVDDAIMSYGAAALEGDDGSFTTRALALGMHAERSEVLRRLFGALEALP